MYQLRLVAVILALLLPVPYLLQSIPNDGYTLWKLDGDVFMYIGQQWLQGQKLYQDIYDIKPPLVFLANAFGLWIGNGSAYGVGVMVWMGMTVFCLTFLRATRDYGIPAGVISLLAMLLWLTRTGIINAVEIYALPFHMAVLYALVEEQSSNDRGRYSLMAGASTAILFMAKANLIFVGITYGCVLAWNAWKSTFYASFLRMVFGATAASILTLALVACRGSLSGFWEASVLQGFSYSGLREPLWKLVYIPFAFTSLAETSLFILPFVSITALALALVNGNRVDRRISLVAIVLLGELVAGAVSGRLYSHYIILMLPTAGYLLAWLLSQIHFDRTELPALDRSFIYILATTFAAVYLFSGFHEAWKSFKVDPLELHIARALKQYYDKDDYIYVWSAYGLSIHYILGAKSPSRFFDTVEILHGPELFRERSVDVAQSLLLKKPKLVVDCASSSVPSLFDATRDFPHGHSIPTTVMDQPMPSELKLLELQYRMLLFDDLSNCVVYRRKTEFVK